MATLSKLAQEKFTAPAVGELLDALQPLEASLPYDDDDASLVRVTRRQYERAVKLPAGVGGRAETMRRFPITPGRRHDPPTIRYDGAAAGKDAHAQSPRC